jgi:hypothetical protein
MYLEFAMLQGMVAHGERMRDAERIRDAKCSNCGYSIFLNGQQHDMLVMGRCLKCHFANQRAARSAGTVK